MKTSKKGIELIKSFEGLRLSAYKCVETEMYYTIGYGHYGKDVKKDATITKEEAECLLVGDLPSYEKKVDKYDKLYNFNQNEYDALVSFAYNVGSIDGLTKKGTRSKDEIAKAFLLYNKSGGKVLDGLQKRRIKERDLFLTVPISEQTYAKYVGNSKKVDIVFRAICVEEKYIGSWTARKKIAEKNGLLNYRGNANENLKLIQLAKNGQLKKP